MNIRYWVGNDAVLLDDTTRFGLHRKHIMRRGGLPDLDSWLHAFPQAEHRVYTDGEGTGHLWLWWKDKEKVPA